MAAVEYGQSQKWTPGKGSRRVGIWFIKRELLWESGECSGKGFGSRLSASHPPEADDGGGQRLAAALQRARRSKHLGSAQIALASARIGNVASV